MFRTFILSIQTKYERWIPIIAFFCGFVFDMILLHRIDEPHVMIQQAIYLVITALLITVDLVEDFHAPFLLRKVWKHREFVLHFLLGTLLNSYTIFYFKSASGLTSFIFIFLLIAALTLSEFKRFGQSQRQVHMGLWSLCLISYIQSLLPILLGFMGVTVFIASGLLSILVFTLYYKFILKLLTKEFNGETNLKKEVLYPYASIHTLFMLLYFFHAIPPVPLSVSYLGIYHGAEKKEGQYHLTFTRSKYKFWQNGDEVFEARPGDPLIAFVQVFMPARFEQQFYVRWLLLDSKRNWKLQDSITLTVTGGREEGYRAVVTKNNYQPGEWRVQIETLDNREVGRLGFTIVADSDTDERDLHVDVR